MKVGFYVPSYKRYEKILTHKILPFCTYVVRKSEEDKYKEVGVNVLAVDDELINSIPKVENYIIENTPEEVIVMLDDDIKNFVYRLEENENIEDEDVIYDEIMRQAQLVVDLNIGYMSTPNDMNPKFYNCEFKFAGVTGQMRIINKNRCKSRFNEIDFLNDIDFELQELLQNRIILIPNYFIADAYVDTNAGGSNENKSLNKYYLANETMKNKWGKYYKVSENGKPGRIVIKR